MPEHVPRSMTRKMAHTDPQAVIDRVFELEAERERLRAALRRAHDMLDAEHGHSAETWDDREAERAE